MKRQISHTIEAIASPIEKSASLFLILFLLGLPVVISFFCNSLVLGGILYLGINFFITYLACAIISLSHPKWLRNLATILILAIIFIMAIFDCFCITIYGEELNHDYVGLIFETNTKEIIEFFKTNLRPQFIALILIATTVFIGGVIYARRACLRLDKRICNYLQYHHWPSFAIILFAIISFSFGGSYASKHPLKRAMLFFSHTNYPDLSQYYVHPDIRQVRDDTSIPQTVILILGESLMRNHCSLYGYEIDTTPHLRQLELEGSLIAFDKVESLATKTARSLRSILSTYHEDCTNWWEHLTIIEAMKECGYHTTWISNQDRDGVYDVLATQYSKICDKAIFNCDRKGSKRFDGELCDITVDKQGNRQFIIYHLLGSHPQFSQRYPDDENIFDEEIYSSLPEHQRYNYATYDNSVHYNDKIVANIMRAYENENAIVVYTSDHALDFYGTDPYYCGHSKNTPESKVFGRQILYTIYLSQEYRNKNPDIEDALRLNIHKNWSASETIYTLIDLVGFELEDGEDQAKYSLTKIS